MKKIRFITLLLVLLFLLSACGEVMPELSESDMELISQYSANLLLKHDSDYDNGLISESRMETLMKRQIIPTAIPTPEITPKPEDETGGDNVGGDVDVPVIDNRTISEFVGIDGLRIDYSYYELVNSYPQQADDDFYFTMDASPGTKLIVMFFDVTNESSGDLNVNILDKSYRFRLFVGDNPQINILSTLLTDDLKTMYEVLSPGQTVSRVLVAEVPDNICDEINNGGTLKLTIKSSDDSLTTNLN